jgi:hypothetical protein
MTTTLTLGPGIQIGAGITLGSLPPAPPAASGSLVFNRSNYLSLPDNSAFAQNAGAWTVECFAYPNPDNTSQIGAFYNRGDISRFLGLYYEDAKFGIIRSSAGFLPGPNSFPKNNWYHVAMVYNGSNLVTLYVNGNNVASANPGSMVPLGSAPTLIGTWSVAQTGSLSFKGNLSNFRVVKGVAVYTGNFTVPTAPLTVTQSSGTNISAITSGQTQLLLNTAAPDYFLDASTNGFTVTNIGSVATSTDNPF